MKFSKILLLSCYILTFSAKVNECTGNLRSSLDDEEVTGDLRSVVSNLVRRIEALEEASWNDQEKIFHMENHIITLENKIIQVEGALDAGLEKIQSLEQNVRTVEQRNLQLSNGPLSNRPVVSLLGNSKKDTDNDSSPCMPVFENNRCIFGNTDTIAFRFESPTFFNDDVEFNENVGFDQDADCMPVYNSTSGQCLMNSNFVYQSGNHYYNNPSKVFFRSKEVWMRPKKVFFRNTQTSFQGGKLEIKKDVNYTNA